MIKDFFNPPSLVLKARAPIMPKAMLAGPSNDAALYTTFATTYVYGCYFFMYRFTILFIQLLLQPFDTTLYVSIRI